jgi:pimeloyl-ACP methyl ester carboxylesterase
LIDLGEDILLVNGDDHSTKSDTPDDAASASASIRTAFGLLERFAPRLGGWWAFRIWCTPPEQSGPLRMPSRLAAAGERFEVRWDGRHTVVGESWGEGPAVYLVHGWGGWRGHLGAFIEPLVAAGHRAIAFDMPGHHESGPGAMGGGRTTAVEFTQALQAVVSAHGPARAIVAHSLGAMVTTTALSRGLTADCVVFLAPMADYEIYLDRFTDWLGFGPRVRRHLRHRLERCIAMPLPHSAMAPLAVRMERPPPLLVLHDPDDSQWPYATSEAVVDAWPGSMLVKTRGLGRLAHLRIMRDRQAIRECVAFVAQVGQADPTVSDGRGGTPGSG